MNPKKYIFAFVITILIFGTALIASTYLSNKKLEDVRNIEAKVNQDILASETQFNLLEETSCSNISPSGFLSSELGPLGDKLSYAESQHYNQADVNALKGSYFLLEIKDYLLMKRVTDKCGNKPTFILYFYSSDNCPDCETMGAVLTELRTRYPNLRVYSFDYGYENASIRTLERMYGVKDQVPALVIGNQVYYGMHTIDDLLSTVPALKKLANASSTASTTKK